ncbi:hypothetical protein HYV43_00660 [Candidatus Micrarchaeota archaeon]|nr:hypothetical protein [Candidatus Micrarchaeota archaeon]
MDKFVVLSALLGILLVTSVFQAFELNGLKNQLTAKTGAVSFASAPAQPASSGGAESYEQMMQRMHPDQFAQQQAASAAVGDGALNGLPNMVGGC